MVHTYPDDEFIPLADAFEQAVTASELCAAACQSIGSATTDAERDDAFRRYDEATREIERAMRTAIADRELHAFVRGSNDKIERIIDCEGFRHEAFGIPGIENIPHHLTNPGVDTDGQPVLLKASNFREWATKSNIALHLSAPRSSSELDSNLYPLMSDLLERGSATSVAAAAKACCSSGDRPRRNG